MWRDDRRDGEGISILRCRMGWCVRVKIGQIVIRQPRGSWRRWDYNRTVLLNQYFLATFHLLNLLASFPIPDDNLFIVVRQRGRNLSSMTVDRCGWGPMTTSHQPCESVTRRLPTGQANASDNETYTWTHACGIPPVVFIAAMVTITHTRCTSLIVPCLRIHTTVLGVRFVATF